MLKSDTPTSLFPLESSLPYKYFFYFLNTCRLTGNLSRSENMSVRTLRAALNVLQDYIFQLCYVPHSSQNRQDK